MTEENPLSVRDRLRAVPVLQGEPPPFDPELAPSEPTALFLGWLDVAIENQVADPHAMTLSTADADGRPDARVLILKDVEPGAVWSFATAVHSTKGRQLAANPQAAMTFWWPTQGRQVRVRGPVEPAERAVSEADLAARSPWARALVRLDRQGSPLNDPDDAARLIAQAQATIEDPVAGRWGVYRLRAETVEFWQADHARMHVRLRYDRDGCRWRRTRLWP